MKHAIPQDCGQIKGPAVIDASLIVSAIVNGAFACELFIKSMLPPNVRGHSLAELLVQLNASIQAKVKNATIGLMKQAIPSYCDSNFLVDLDT